jgi:hypothetical protein
MGRKRGELKRGQSTNMYIPLDLPDDELNWINEQMYLNKSIFSLIHKEVNKISENKNIIDIIQKEISKALKEIQIVQTNDNITTCKSDETFKFNEVAQSELQKKVLSSLDL